MAADLANDKFWVNKYLYHDAEKSYYEAMSKPSKSKDKRGHLEKKDGVGMTNISKDSGVKSSLAGEVAKAREILKTSMQRVGGISAMAANDKSSGCNINNNDLAPLIATVARLESCLNNFEKRLSALEALNKINQPSGGAAASAPGKQKAAPAKAKKDDDDVDLFGSDSDEEDEQAKKIREQRLAEYAAKKSKKPTIVAKSNIVLDIKPWNDETDMKKLEEAVRKIEMDGLVWGASRLMPLVFGIYKLQISCVVEDDKVSVDQLTETITDIEEYVQSADIAAFNKV